MGCVQQAVQEFDEAVRAPWRPRLVSVPDVPEPAPVRDAAVRPHPSRRSPSRVGVLRPSAPVELSSAPVRHVARGHGRRVPASDVRSARPARRPRVTVGRPAPTRLRLTRRARRLAVVLALAAGVVLGSWLGPLLSGGGGGDELRLVGESAVVVKPGDTLWSIASSVAGGDDVRAVVDRIQQLNGLDGAHLAPGQTLHLP